MEALKYGFQPKVTGLEGREQPGSMFSTGLDGSLLAGAFIGEAIVKAARPAVVTIQARMENSDAPEIALLPTRSSSVQTKSTSMQADTQPVGEIPGLSDRRVFATLADYARANPGLEQRPGDFAGTRGANLLNYNGDWDGRNGLANEFNTSVTDARTYDGFRIRGGAVKDCFFSHNVISGLNATTANVHILGPGDIIRGQPNGGLPTVFQSSNLPATQALTGLSGFGMEEVEHRVCGLGLSFGPGHFWVNVQPIGDGSGRSFNSTTSGMAVSGSGQNGTVSGGVKGQPGINGMSYFDSPYFGYTFQPVTSILGADRWDFTIGICSAPAC